MIKGGGRRWREKEDVKERVDKRRKKGLGGSGGGRRGMMWRELRDGGGEKEEQIEKKSGRGVGKRGGEKE